MPTLKGILHIPRIMPTVIHDGNGTYFPAVQPLYAQHLTDDELDCLESGDESVLNAERSNLVFNVGTFDNLLAVVTLWMPDAQVGEDRDGQIIIYTGTSSRDGKLETLS